MSALRRLRCGVNASGSETWSDQSLYCTGAAIGAPPDPIGVGGQEWGIPPQDPRALKRAAMRLSWRWCAPACVTAARCGLDHVMALFRQWWVPRGLKSADGGYVHYPLEDCSPWWRSKVTGSNAWWSARISAWCPTRSVSALPQFGVYHYKVVMFEQKGGSFVAPADYVRHALATVTTHDLPTLHGWWSGHDIDLWEKLGFYADADVAANTRARRADERARLLRALRREILWPGDDDGIPEYLAELARAVHVFLARTKAALVTVQLEDMIGMLEPVNVPGTSREYSNWTRRMTASATDIFARAEVRALATAVSGARRE
jgi:4-alpha-glucanotransferase